MSYRNLALNELIRAGLAAGAKVEGSPADKAALATDLALEAQTGHYRQRYRLPRAGRCGCGCGEKIAANKQFKFGHEAKPAEVPDAGN